MVERRTEFPRLEMRLAYLEHEFYSAQKQSNDAIYAGRPDNATQLWLEQTGAELDELRYVLRVFGQPNQLQKFDVSVNVLILFFMVMAALAVVLYRF